ncbi:MAG: MlaE family lipid ABC transporter permease subunit [Candidatus Latescibacterota bacterium]
MEVLNRADGIRLEGPLTVWTVGRVTEQVRRLLAEHPGPEVRVDASGLTRLDAAGAVFLHRLAEAEARPGCRVAVVSLPEGLRAMHALATPPAVGAGTAPTIPTGTLERLGGWIADLYRELLLFLYLAADLTWAAVAALPRRQGIRRGTFLDQAVAIGSQAVPIVALILFLIGAVSILQAAAQLRQFGADIYTANLLAIGITRELGPLMTAILVSGRSGSAIAAEVATMKFTEELDALQTMGLEPLRFVAVPKLWAMMVCVPLLTILADFVGILGGSVIGIASMGLAPQAFLDQLVGALFLKDILTGLLKSLSYAWAITVIAVHRGLGFRGGATGVGQATTSSVVASIFGIIALDCLWGLVFYLR